MFDLRSDTVTRPTEGMRQAMARAEVGDDVYGEDPTVRRLEERVAELTGKAAALFVPSGTMSNQIALLCHCRPGDEVIVPRGAHCANYESGAGAAWSGVQFAQVGEDGLFDAAALDAAIRPDAYWAPHSRLVVVENTHNRSGGRVFPPAQAEGVVALAHGRCLAAHLDGARIWNAAMATGRPVSELCAGFDTVGVCFSKGLGAPVGAALCSDAETRARARRWRKMLGGGMRQAGILAAGALYAIEHQRERLADDHAAARLLGQALGAVAGARVVPVETNMVSVAVDVPAERVVEAARRRGVLVGATGPRRLRLVTHLDVVGPGFAAAVDALVLAFRETLAGC
ncbi:MAG: low-specificity L-threonine aldolase [Deltaproteobacteria bacterium]|nr:low-specificity L-threonine aldolase [Deltaproteobacteria bacterium]